MGDLGIKKTCWLASF